jgi:cell division protein FtsA
MKAVASDARNAAKAPLAEDPALSSEGEPAETPLEEAPTKPPTKAPRKNIFDVWSEKLKDFLDNAE